MDTSAEIQDLKNAVKVALRNKGVLDDIKSRLRAEIYLALEDKSVVLPPKTAQISLAAEIIKDFCNCLNLNNSLIVFSEECGQTNEMQVDREFISNELGFQVTDVDGKVPILLYMIQMLQAVDSRNLPSLSAKSQDT